MSVNSEAYIAAITGRDNVFTSSLGRAVSCVLSVYLVCTLLGCVDVCQWSMCVCI